ncbi:putative T7SS-secreted protein [Streptomyces boninensis]|uniref:putative T7SS-secreted protein n=1 Tax=Streptomyces boninensis TaxID=2039455 RepID=UPI003B219CA1
MAAGKGRKRPVDWHPLAEKDPVPGDPEDIRTEVGKMKDMAKNLRDQAAILRKVANGEALEGKYADKIREKSDDLEKHFRETAARYERVVGDLGKWANELEDIQEDADGILKAAKKADEEHTAKEAKKGVSLAPYYHPPYAPDDHLASYRKRLYGVVSHRDTRAQHYADNIGDDISDIIKDSGWENFKDWVHENADWIKTVVEVLSWAATIVGILALIFTPVGWLATAMAVFAITATALVGVGHTMLALSGDGNWTDVAMDVFALATFGLGKIAMQGVKTAHASLKLVSRAGRFERYTNLRKLINRNIMRYGAASDRGQKALRAQQSLRRLGSGEVRPVASRLERVLGGDGEVASASKFAKRMRAEFSGNADVVRAADESLKKVAKFRVNYGAATGVDALDKFGEKMVGEPYGDVKDVLTREVGSRW